MEWNCLHNYFRWIENLQPSLAAGNKPLLKPYGRILRRDVSTGPLLFHISRQSWRKLLCLCIINPSFSLWADTKMSFLAHVRVLVCLFAYTHTRTLAFSVLKPQELGLPWNKIRATEGMYHHVYTAILHNWETPSEWVMLKFGISNSLSETTANGKDVTWL